MPHTIYTCYMKSHCIIDYEYDLHLSSGDHLEVLFGLKNRKNNRFQFSSPVFIENFTFQDNIKVPFKRPVALKLTGVVDILA